MQCRCQHSTVLCSSRRVRSCLQLWHLLQPRSDLAEIAPPEAVDELSKHQVRLCHSNRCTCTDLSAFLMMPDIVVQSLQVGPAQLIILVLVA